MSRGWTGRVALLVGSLALCATAAEVGLRALDRGTGIAAYLGRRGDSFDVFRRDASLGYALRPGWTAVHDGTHFRVTVSTNEMGLRGPPADPQKAPGAARILVLGDSFAFGFGVEDREAFPRVLESLLAADRREGVEVLNAAVPGYSADHHLILLRERGLALEPDLVLVAACSNDVSDLGWVRLELGADGLPTRTRSLRRLIDYRGRLRYPNEARVPLPELRLPGLEWLRQHSRLHAWLRFRLTRAWVVLALRTGAARRALEAGPAPEGPIGSLAPAEISSGLATSQPFRLRYHRFLMAALEREAAARDVPVRTVLTGTPGGAMKRDCAAAAGHCLDAHALFTPESAPEHFLPDGHWSASGHARVAAELRSWLQADPDLGLGAPRPGAP